MKNTNTKILIAIIVLISICAIYLLFKNFTVTNDFNKYKLRYEKYVKIKNKKVLELSESDWILINEFKVEDAKILNQLPDTISFQEALNKEKTNLLMNEINSPCSETELINTFYKMMEFNYPNTKFNKHKIHTQYDKENCSIKLSLNITEGGGSYVAYVYHVVYEVRYDNTDSKYKLNELSRELVDNILPK